MTVYHQMGHDSKNLLSSQYLDRFRGAIISPLNEDKGKVISIIKEYKDNPNFETIFDTQLYYPRTAKNRLRNWSYFPSIYNTVDANRDWWLSLNNQIFDIMKEIAPDAVCSPVQAPKKYSEGYYDECVTIGNDLYHSLEPYNIEVLQTVLINMHDLNDINSVFEIASIITKTDTKRIYLVFVNSVTPRKELRDYQEIKGAMQLIKVLKKAKLDVVVGYSSSDMILWKTAGASSCATGKFWNLRRFTPSRWDETDKGGSQFSYWFEESLLASVRDIDITRLEKNNLISLSSVNNPLYNEIQNKRSTNTAWVSSGWKQYLYWFADMEHRIENGLIDVPQLLKECEDNWAFLESNTILLDERENNGSWIRAWRQAVAEYDDI